MSELGEIYSAWKEIKKDKKLSNLKQSLSLLDNLGIEYRALSSTHYRVGAYDYWPSTGLFIHTKTKKRGRGVCNLIEKQQEAGREPK
jgi:hypothetical protein